MATLIPALGTCVARMTSGERRWAERLQDKLEDDYLLWWDVPIGPKQTRPDFVVLKDIAGYERGRASGEIAAIMRARLLADGVADDSIVTCLDETEAARTALAWARDGDLLVLPIHEMEARAQVGALLDEMTKTGWKPGDPLP